ncbi:LysR family transcriptional regulator [Burkholderia cenocepacia]|uniref:LysR family transcriptional regulator n=2 Tax=Burkholderia cenocepacia TaxID=95486 RepID=A0AAD0IWK5_9BURK|nr:LysR family transcriptional regulator [Burkholderia cenocepacia]EAY64964.1 regulatory protein, LysR [Burkholderia cenocepacia PC184]HEM7882953.1 LysR family transcriptional regulator [Burkholderia cenocepacia]
MPPLHRRHRRAIRVPAPFAHLTEPMSLRAFRTLVAIARYRTFARAGEAIGLTQSAVSLQIKTLESEYNVQLFDRSRRQPVLTEAGNILLAQAKQVLAMVDRIPDALSDEKKLVGRLRIGAIQTALSGPLPDALLALRAAHPSLRVHVSAGMSVELANRVAAGELDAAITTRPVRPHPAELTWTTLYEDRFWLLVPPGHAERDAGALLDALPFIRFDAQAWAGRMIAAELRRIGVRVREEMVLDSAETIARMVARGLGAAIVALPDATLARLPPVTRLPFGQPQMGRAVVLLEHQSRPAERFARALAAEVTASSMRISH